MDVLQGWCGSADPRKRQYETKHSEADEIRKEIEDIKVKKEIEHQDINSGVKTTNSFALYKRFPPRLDVSWCLS